VEPGRRLERGGQRQGMPGTAWCRGRSSAG